MIHKYRLGYVCVVGLAIVSGVYGQSGGSLLPAVLGLFRRAPSVLAPSATSALPLQMEASSNMPPNVSSGPLLPSVPFPESLSLPPVWVDTWGWPGLFEGPRVPIYFSRSLGNPTTDFSISASSTPGRRSFSTRPLGDGRMGNPYERKLYERRRRLDEMERDEALFPLPVRPKKRQQPASSASSSNSSSSESLRSPTSSSLPHQRNFSTIADCMVFVGDSSEIILTPENLMEKLKSLLEELNKENQSVNPKFDRISNLKSAIIGLLMSVSNKTICPWGPAFINRFVAENFKGETKTCPHLKAVLGASATEEILGAWQNAILPGEPIDTAESSRLDLSNESSSSVTAPSATPPTSPLVEAYYRVHGWELPGNQSEDEDPTKELITNYFCG